MAQPRIHTFESKCIDFTSLLATPSLDNLLKNAKAQAHTHEAHVLSNPTYKAKEDYSDASPEFCPSYYGGFTEWFADKYLNYYGHKYNLTGVEMINVVGSAEEDLGTDGRGIVLKPAHHPEIKSISFKAGSMVHIQVKGSLSKGKEHTANDGSRLPNFIMNALSNAVVAGQAYNQRYLLFTTAAGMHYKLNKMCNHIVEVINYTKIKKMMDGDLAFLNHMRTAVKLPVLPYATIQMDPDAAWNINNC